MADSEKTQPSARSTADWCTFDEVIEFVHPLGPFQLSVYAMIALGVMSSSWVNVAITFMQLPPKYYCNQYPKRNLSSFVLGNASTADGSCNILKENLLLANVNSSMSTLQTLAKSRNNTQTCTNFSFAKDGNMSDTIVSDFHLVCSDKSYVAHANTMLHIGTMVGTVVVGPISDRFGRRHVAAVGTLGGAVLAIADSFAPTYASFVIIRVGMAATMTLAALAWYILAFEITSSKHRGLVTALFWLPYAIGYSTLPIFAATFRNWRHMHVAISVPYMVVVLSWLYFPESPRWQLATGQVAAAEATIRRAAKWNGVTLPDNMDLTNLAANIAKQDGDAARSKKGILEIFRPRDGSWVLLTRWPVLGRRALILFVLWFDTAYVYYFYMLNMSFYKGNVFVTNAVAGLIEIPAYLASWPLLAWGRKSSMIVSILVTTVSFLVMSFIDDTWNVIGINMFLIVALIGKFGSTIAYCIIYTHTSELYPTAIRNSGLALSVGMGKIGAIMSAYAMLLNDVDSRWPHLAEFVTFVSTIVAIACMLALPETLGKQLPETIEKASTLTEATDGKKVALEKEGNCDNLK